MNWTENQRLHIWQFITNRIESADNIDYAIPSPLSFSDKADFWNVMKTVSPHLTQKSIETSLIRAVWMNETGFDTDNPDSKHPLYTVNFEITATHEYKYEKLNAADPFQIRILKSYFEHKSAVSSLVSEFAEGVDITGLEADFDKLKVIGLTQTDHTVFGNLAYLPSVRGFQTKLICRVLARNKC